MKKVITFSLFALLASPMFVGCKSGTSCFTRPGSRVPIVSSFDDSTYAAAGPGVINAAGTGEVIMMSTTSAASQCAPCAPTSCNPCDPCTPCGSSQGATGGYPAGAYAGM
ncbi:MAG: hypothetical protein PHO46_05855 [Thermoguttaceae bacterium]|nr:hypothetical protein [Thermoguttaceae bacterium]